MADRKSQKEMIKILERNGFCHLRQNKHAIYSDGRYSFPLMGSPSDHRSWKNAVREFKSLLRKAGRPYVDEDGNQEPL